MSQPPAASTRRSVVNEVLRLTGPAVLTSLLQTLAFLADRIMLGRHSAASLGSMQISGTVLWSVFSVCFGALVGTVALVARRVGAGELERARVMARSALRLAALLGLIVAVLGSLSAHMIAMAMAPPHASGVGVDQAVVDAATDYMRVGFWCALPDFIATAGALTLNASGDTKSTFYIGSIANLLNIAANYLLIFGATIGPLTIPELGPSGAALATTLGYSVQCVLILWVLRRPGCVVRVTHPFRGRLAELERTARRELVRLSKPAIVERVVIHVGYVSFAAIVASLGAAAMAANQALLTLESICFLTAEGFGIAAATVVGQSLGRREGEASSYGGWFAALACAATLSCCGLLIWASADWSLSLFVAAGESGDELIAVAMRTVPVLVITQPMMAIAVVLGHGLRGAGDTRSPVLAAFVGGLLVRLIAAWLLAVELGLGLPGIWIASTLDWSVRCLILGTVFVRGRWRVLTL